MPSARMSELWLQNLKAPATGRVEYLDAKRPGLSLRITHTGRKTWNALYRVAGDPTLRRLKLGEYPAYSLKEAARMAQEAILAAQRGEDKRERRKARKTAPTVEDLAEEFKTHHAAQRASGAEMMRLLNKDVLPAWRKRKAEDIRRRDLILLRDEIVQRGAPITANRVQGLVIKLFNFAVDRDILPASPFAGMRKLSEQSRSRALSDDEIRAFWTGLEQTKLTKALRLVLRLILVTGQRPGEVASVTKAEIVDGVWIMAAPRTKNRRAHRVPLSSLAAELFAEAAKLDPESPLFFPSPTADGPIDRHSLSRALVRNLPDMKLEHFTPHDLRRTCRTKLSELGIDHTVSELILNHTLDGMQAVYDQYSYDKEKRAALETWASRLRAILGEEQTGKVVQIKHRT